MWAKKVEETIRSIDFLSILSLPSLAKLESGASFIIIYPDKHEKRLAMTYIIDLSLFKNYCKNA